MFRSLIVAGVMVMAAPEVIRYPAKPASSVRMTGGYTLSVDVTGPEAVITQLRTTNIILGMKTIRISGEGHRDTSVADAGTNSVQFRYDAVHVDGTLADKPFVFDFTPPNVPDKSQDPIRNIAWALSMAGRSYRLGDKGQYSQVTTAADTASDEALGIIIDAPVRLSERAVSVDERWTNDWVGTAKRAKDGAWFRYQQTAKLDASAADASGRRRISFQTTGKLEAPAGIPLGEDAILDAKGLIVLDPKLGVVSTSTSGTITSNFPAAGVKLVRRVEAKYDAK